MSRIVVDPKVCAGCLACTMKCSAYHYGASSLHLSNIKITGDEATACFTPLLCACCAEKSCIAACPTEALKLHENTDAVIIDSELCIMCEACVEACGYNGIRVRSDPEGNSCIGVCDQCGGEPQCVKYCRQGALKYITN